jgi:uncharacterized protein YheU (UPF0270 family)
MHLWYTLPPAVYIVCVNASVIRGVCNASWIIDLSFAWLGLRSRYSRANGSVLVLTIFCSVSVFGHQQQNTKIVLIWSPIHSFVSSPRWDPQLHGLCKSYCRIFLTSIIDLNLIWSGITAMKVSFCQSMHVLVCCGIFISFPLCLVLVLRMEMVVLREATANGGPEGGGEENGHVHNRHAERKPVLILCAINRGVASCDVGQRYFCTFLEGWPERYNTYIHAFSHMCKRGQLGC